MAGGPCQNPKARANPRFDTAGRRSKLGAVLVEYKNVRQEPGCGPRRWFEGGGFELVVWYRADGPVEGFQILHRHRHRGRERALTWRDGAGFSHGRVDNGMGSPLKNLTPILLPNGGIPWEEVLREFDESSGSLEPALRALVRRRLEARG